MPDVREELEVLAERRPRDHRPVVAERVKPAAHVLPRRVGHRRVAPAAVAHDLGRHALADRALGGGVREQREVAVAVRVDEPGADDLPRRVDDPRGGGRAVEPADLRDPAVLDRDVAEERRAPGAVGDPAAADQDVEHAASHLVSLAPPTCGPRRGSRMSRRPSPRKLKPSTTIMIASPGKIESHGWHLEVRAGAREHASPRRLRRLRAEAEEAERGLGEDRGGEVDGHEHDDGRRDVRHHVARHDPPVRGRRAPAPTRRTGSPSPRAPRRAPRARRPA